MGPPPDGDATPAEISADVLLLVRAMNRQDTEDGVAEASTSGRGALDALVGDLLSAQRLHMDQEIASTLAAYYRGVLTDPASLNEYARITQNSLKTLAQLLQEGGAHLPAQEVDALISALLAKISKKSTNKTSQAGEGESSRARGGAMDTARHALNALGALVSRASTGCVTTQAHVAVGEAIVSALDAETRGDGVSPEGAPRTMGRARPAEDASSSRFFAAATRCAHVCAGCGVWPERVVSALVTHLRRFFAYGVYKQTNAQTPEHVTNDVPTSPTRGGYVPPHLRTAESSRGYGSSDSDASESDGGRGGEIGDRFGASKVRANAALCVSALARANPRSLHAHWPKLLPTSVAQLLARSPTPTVVRCALNDPSPRVRAAALAATAHLLEGPATRTYFAAAEVRFNSKTGAVIRANFASLSSTLGDTACATHEALVRAVRGEPALSCLPAACKALSAFHDAAPFSRLPRDLVPKALGGIQRRLLDLPTEGGASRVDGEVGAARVSLLAALTAALAAKGAPVEVTDSLMPGLDDSPSGSLGGILPGLVRYAAGGDGSGTRCEAFGALRAAATAHPAAVSAMLDADDSFGFRSILPASTFAASRGNEDGDGDVRVAQASAKLLADFLAAVGGGGAGTAAEDDPSQ